MMNPMADQIIAVIASTLIVYGAILFYTRMVGLRSFSKMSASDFAMTLAVGSLLASTAVSPQTQLVPGLVALATLFCGQLIIASTRSRSRWVSKIVDNQPLLLMLNGEILDANLNQANVSRQDLYAKLREANAHHLKDVQAVVFETTGDISVIHSSHSNDISLELLEGVSVGAAKLDR